MKIHYIFIILYITHFGEFVCMQKCDLEQEQLDLDREKFEWEKQYTRAKLALEVLKFADRFNDDTNVDQSNLRYNTALRRRIIFSCHDALQKFFNKKAPTQLQEQTNSNIYKTPISHSRKNSYNFFSESDELILDTSSESFDKIDMSLINVEQGYQTE